MQGTRAVVSRSWTQDRGTCRAQARSLQSIFTVTVTTLEPSTDAKPELDRMTYFGRTTPADQGGTMPFMRA